jgi:hypothetical protein
MNLTDQLGALESSLDELISAAASIPVSSESSTDSVADAGVEPATASGSTTSVVEEKPPVAEPPVAEEKPTLNVSRPEKNLIAMTIGGVSVALSPGWRFVAPKNPVMATQRYANGDRLLVLRHTGHGWVPFSFSPDMVIEMYAMLTKR